MQKQTDTIEETPNGIDDKSHCELKTYSVKDILMNFVPDNASETANKVLDPQNWTSDKIANKSVSYIQWLCMLPLICTCACVQKVFKLQVSIIQAFLLKLFPDLPQKVDKTKDLVQPMFGAIKTTAFRLAIAATIITGAFVCCSVFYFAVYYLVMPVLR